MTELIRILILEGGAIILVGGLLWLLSNSHIDLQDLPEKIKLSAAIFPVSLSLGSR